MKYGESTFDILYLIFAVCTGIWILAHRENDTERDLGVMALVLGFGDAFHLEPPVLNYFIDADFTAALGVGKLVTSVTMTLFYLLLYRVWRAHYCVPEDRRLTCAVLVLTAARVLLCLFPQNGWLSNSGDVLWGTLRNLPFAALGALLIVLFFRKRRESRIFRRVWLWVLLSFLFYLPVAVGASLLPMLGMLMLPKTVCYIILLTVFLRAVRSHLARPDA